VPGGDPLWSAWRAALALRSQAWALTLCTSDPSAWADWEAALEVEREAWAAWAWAGFPRNQML